MRHPHFNHGVRCVEGSNLYVHLNREPFIGHIVPAGWICGRDAAPAVMRAASRILVQKVAVGDASKLNRLVSVLHERSSSAAVPTVVVQDGEGASIAVLNGDNFTRAVAAIARLDRACIAFGDDVVLDSFTVREVGTTQHAGIHSFSVLHVELLAWTE